MPILPGRDARVPGNKASKLYPPTLLRTFGYLVSISFLFFSAILISFGNTFSNPVNPFLTSPKCAFEPSDKIAFIANTLSLIIPYRIDRPPAELLPAIPPMVALLDVETSTGNQRPNGFNCRFSSSRTTPGSTTHVRFFSLISTILFKYLLLSKTIA